MSDDDIILGGGLAASDLTPNVSQSVPVQHFETGRTVTPKDIATVVRFLGIEAAARAVEAEWDAYIGSGDDEGHDDPVLVGERIAALREALEVEV